jgi:hypothetical protein
MAGLALYGDLTPVLADTRGVTLRHRLESVKVLPPDGYEPKTHFRPSVKSLVLTWATSAATSQAACIATIIAAEYPSLARDLARPGGPLRRVDCADEIAPMRRER